MIVLILIDDYMHDDMEHELSFFFDNSHIETVQNYDKKYMYMQFLIANHSDGNCMTWKWKIKKSSHILNRKIQIK